MPTVCKRTAQQHGRIGVGRLPTEVEFVAWSGCGLRQSQQLQTLLDGRGIFFTLTCTVRGLLRVECRGSPVVVGDY
jgi:hypothetical protein